MSNVYIASDDLYKGALSSAPSGPATGWMYYNTTDGNLYVYANGIWNAISGGAPSTFRVLMENSDIFTLENNDYLRTE